MLRRAGRVLDELWQEYGPAGGRAGPAGARLPRLADGQAAAGGPRLRFAPVEGVEVQLRIDNASISSVEYRPASRLVLAVNRVEHLAHLNVDPAGQDPGYPRQPERSSCALLSSGPGAGAGGVGTARPAGVSGQRVVTRRLGRRLELDVGRLLDLLQAGTHGGGPLENLGHDPVEQLGDSFDGDERRGRVGDAVGVRFDDGGVVRRRAARRRWSSARARRSSGGRRGSPSRP